MGVKLGKTLYQNLKESIRAYWEQRYTEETFSLFSAEQLALWDKEIATGEEQIKKFESYYGKK